MKNIRSVVLLLPFFLFFACSVEPPKAAIEKVRVLDASIDKVRSELTLRVENPNSFAIRIEEIRYTLYANGDKIVEDRTQKKFDIPSKGSTKIDLPIGFSPARAVGAGFDSAFKRRVHYRAEAVVVVGTSLGKIEVPVSESGTLSW